MAQPCCYSLDDLSAYAASERTAQAAAHKVDTSGTPSNGYNHAAAAAAAASHPSPSKSANATADAPQKERRHRNKPALSCEVCTVKKTKCDRGRPECFACQKRKTACHYSQLADMIEESHRAQGIESPRKRQKATKKNDGENSNNVLSPMSATAQLAAAANTNPMNSTTPLRSASLLTFNQDRPASRPTDRTPSRSSTGSSPTLLSNIPFSHPTASNIFKVEVWSMILSLLSDAIFSPLQPHR